MSPPGRGGTSSWFLFVMKDTIRCTVKADLRIMHVPLAGCPAETSLDCDGHQEIVMPCNATHWWGPPGALPNNHTASGGPPSTLHDPMWANPGNLHTVKTVFM